MTVMIFSPVVKQVFQWKPGFSGHDSCLLCWSLVYLQVHGSYHLISLTKLFQQFHKSSPRHLLRFPVARCHEEAYLCCWGLKCVRAPSCSAYVEPCIVSHTHSPCLRTEKELCEGWQYATRCIQSQDCRALPHLLWEEQQGFLMPTYSLYRGSGYMFNTGPH